MKPHGFSEQKILTAPLTRVCLAVMCCLLWGGACPVLKLGYAYLGISSSNINSLILFAGIRFGCAGLLLILFYSLLQKKLLIPQKHEIKPILSMCLCQTTFHYLFYYIGISYLTGVKSSVFQGSTAFFTIISACFLFRQERFTKRKLLSCAIGFFAILISNLDGLDLLWRWQGEGIFLLSTFLAGASNCLSKEMSKIVPVQKLTGYQFFVGGLFLVIIGLLTGGSLAFTSKGSVLTFAYLVLAGAIAQTIWAFLLKYNDASKIGIFTLCTPIFGVLLSAVVLPGEGLSPVILLSLFLVCIGIALANNTKKISVT